MKQRLAGRDVLAALMPPMPRFLWGLALMPLIAFTKDWITLSGELAAAALLMALSGKRLKPAGNAIFFASVVAFSLLNPRGLVLAAWGPFRVTQDALFEGLRRGASILCLVFVSEASVNPGLRLPGRLGSLLSGVFASFSRLMESKRKIDRRDWAASVDAALFGLFDPDEPFEEKGSGPAPGGMRVSGPRLAAGIAIFAATWAGALAAMVLSRA